MVKAIIFDIGGVLDKGKPEEHWAELCKSLNLDFEKFQAIRKKYTDDARIGKLSTKEYVSKIAKDLGLKYEDLFSNWLRTKRENMKIDKEIENLIKNLKKKGYKVATLSNIIELHHQVRIENKAYGLFDFAVISFKYTIRFENLDAAIKTNIITIIKKINIVNPRSEHLVFFGFRIKYVNIFVRIATSVDIVFVQDPISIFPTFFL